MSIENSGTCGEVYLCMHDLGPGLLVIFQCKVEPEINVRINKIL